MFEQDRFIEQCRAALSENDAQAAIRELVARAVSDGNGVMAALGEPSHAGITPLHRSPDLTILNFVWAPCMSLMPHNHQMFSVVGIYSGREDNVFWRRVDSRIEAAGARSLGTGEVATLGPDVIHSVLNPIGKMSCAIHVYGGDFFDPVRPRSQWDHESLREQPWNIDEVKLIFKDAERRYNAVRR
jgi:predicted metal-dependent enzyme (double-stranded beta helix superfamily)